jgi:hypothetical protein
METGTAVIVVPSPERAEQDLVDGLLRCPDCEGVLRRHGWARRRTVRGPGARRLVVTPRRARCAACAATHVVLPGELCPRRADSAEVIGQALVEHALGAGWRAIAARTGRPESTVRRWLRAAPEAHAERLFHRGEQIAVRVAPDLINPWTQPRDTLAAALDILLRTAQAYQQVLKLPYPLWALVNTMAGGCLLAPRRT